jgi:hypothetical protein
VRNFVSHNKSFTFRLTLRSLLDMGYQVGGCEGVVWGIQSDVLRGQGLWEGAKGL